MDTLEHSAPLPTAPYLMPSDIPSTNGDAHIHVNPTPPEQSSQPQDDQVPPKLPDAPVISDVPPPAEPPLPIQQPAEHVEAGIAGVADFLPADAKTDHPTPSPDEPLDTGSVDVNDTLMTDAAPSSAPDPLSTSHGSFTQPSDVSEPVQQHTPAPEVSEAVPNGVPAAGEPLPLPQQQDSSASHAPAPEQLTEPMERWTPPATDPVQADADKTTSASEVPAEQSVARPKSEEGATEAAMNDSASTLTRQREDGDAGAEPSAKRVRLDESATEPSTEAPKVEAPDGEEFKRPEIPSQPQPTSFAAAAASPTNGNASGHLPSRNSYSHEPMTKLQKKLLEEKIKNTKKVKSAALFLKPVDWEALNIPSYPTIIKQPMDLSTMENKLRRDEYTSLEGFVADFELMVNNCFTFNGPAHAVSVQAQNLRAYFLKQMDSMPTADAATLIQKPKKESSAAKPQPRRESRASAGPGAQMPAPPVAASPPAASARSPANDTFALLPGGTPQIRRDSTAGRPKRQVIAPSRDLPYAGSKPKRKENLVGLKFCEHILAELRKPRYDAMTLYFREPVDPVALNIPHYFQIVKKPMDIQTITNKLKNGQYGSAEEFKSDFDLVFNNCFKFNPPDNGVHIAGKTLQSEFEALWREKNSWIKKNQPRSQRVTPATDDSDAADSSEEEDEAEEEDEKEATIRKLKEQLETMQNMLGSITDLKRESPKASGKKKSRSSGGATKPKKSSVSAAPAKAAPKAKRQPKAHLVTYDEKQEISNATENMNEAQINKLTSIITENVAKYKDMAGDDVELEIDDLPNDVQLKLLKYVRSIFPKAKTAYAEDEDFGVDDDYEPERAVKSGGSTRKKHKPMKKKEQEDRIALLNAKIEGMKSGGAAQPAAPRHESSGDEDSESSEEE